MQSIVVIGSGRYAGVVIDIILEEKVYNIEGVLCDYGEVGTEINGYKVLGGLDLLKGDVLPRVGVVAVGDSHRREQYVESLVSLYPDFTFVSTIHPSAVISRTAAIGEGTVVHAFSVIKYNTRVGRHSNINSHVTIAHDVVLEDYTTIGAGVMIGGYVKIGAATAIDLGSVIRDRISIGEYGVIGMGSVVTKDVAPYTFSCGNPSRVMRKRAKEDGFL